MRLKLMAGVLFSMWAVPTVSPDMQAYQVVLLRMETGSDAVESTFARWAQEMT
jgi:hypothetical protein